MRKILTGIVAALTMVATAAYALTFPPTYPVRQFNTQQTHYMRFTFNFNSCVVVSNVCGVKVGAVPYNAFLKAVYLDLTTNFNSGSADTIALGNAQIIAPPNSLSTESNILGSQNVHAGGGLGLGLTFWCGATCGSGSFAGIGLTNTGQGTTPTGTSGGFDIWANYKSTSTAPTAGQYVGIIEYIAPNDGACVPTPIDSPTGVNGYTLQSVC